MSDPFTHSNLTILTIFFDFIFKIVFAHVRHCFKPRGSCDTSSFLPCLTYFHDTTFCFSNLLSRIWCYAWKLHDIIFCMCEPACICSWTYAGVWGGRVGCLRVQYLSYICNIAGICSFPTLVCMLYLHNLQVWSFIKKFSGCNLDISVTSPSIYFVNTTYSTLYLMNQA